MKKVITALIGMVLALSASAAELSQAALQGNWLITEFMGEANSDGDMWQFEGNKFYQNLSGKRISPDDFTIYPQGIDLGYAKIKVTSFDGKVMQAIMAGARYTLKKQ